MPSRRLKWKTSKGLPCLQPSETIFIFPCRDELTREIIWAGARPETKKRRDKQKTFACAKLAGANFKKRNWNPCIAIISVCDISFKISIKLILSNFEVLTRMNKLDDSVIFSVMNSCFLSIQLWFCHAVTLQVLFMKRHSISWMQRYALTSQCYPKPHELFQKILMPCFRLPSYFLHAFFFVSLLTFTNHCHLSLSSNRFNYLRLYWPNLSFFKAQPSWHYLADFISWNCQWNGPVCL